MASYSARMSVPPPLIGAGPAFERRGVDHREVELAIGGAQLVEEFEGLVDDPVGARAGTVDLVHHHDGFRPSASALRVTKRVCGIGPSTASTTSSTRVDHRQHALHFAAEVGVARACRRC